MKNRGGSGSPLDRALSSIWKPYKRRRAARQKGLAGLGASDFDQDNRVGQVPDIVGRPAPGHTMDRVFDGTVEDPLAPESGAPTKCPPWMTPECFLILSRFLEETFRNFQLNARLPSHISPPFRALPIDAFPAAGTVTIPAGGAFTTVTSFRITSSRHRGEIQALGQSAESGAAWADLEWRVTIDGIPYDPYTAFSIQLFQMVPPTPLCNPIHLRPPQTIALQARAVAAGPWEVLGRICGYEYPVRSESGDEIRSTLVD